MEYLQLPGCLDNLSVIIGAGKMCLPVKGSVYLICMKIKVKLLAVLFNACLVSIDANVGLYLHVAYRIEFAFKYENFAVRFVGASPQRWKARI